MRMKPTAFPPATHSQDPERARELASSLSDLIRLALRLSRTCAWQWYPQTGAFDCIDGTEAMRGAEPGVSCGSDDEIAARVHPDDLERWRLNWSKCVAAEGPLRFECRLVCPDASVRWLGVDGDAILGADGCVERVVGVVREISRHSLADDECSRFFAMSPHLFVIASLDGTIRRVNPAWAGILGYSQDELVGRRFLDFLDAGNVEATAAEIASLAEGLSEHCFETRHRARDGSVLTLAWSATALLDSGLLFAVGQDITARALSEQALALVAIRYRELIENMNDAVAVFTAVGDGEDFLFTSLNPAGARIGCVDARQIVGASVREVFPGIDAMGGLASLRRVFRTGTPEKLPMRRYKDDRLDQWLEGHVYKLPSGEVVAVYSNVTDRRLAEQALRDTQRRLEYLAYYDQLTGLPNRRLLQDRLQQAIAVADRTGSRLAVCYLDLDDFKPINDQCGHEVGDALLRAVAERLQSCVRPSDSVARWGGDEFALLLTDVASLEFCTQTLSRILRNLSDRRLIEAQVLPVSASIGVTLYPDDPGDADTLLRHADHAMYLAKQRGRNNFQFFDPEEDRLAIANRTLLRRIRQAIEQHELRIAYQPIVNLRQGVVEAVEGLVRWQHPESGLLLPHEFLPAIEGIDLIRKLDRWVLQEVLSQQAAWADAGLQLRMQINVSAHSLMAPGFIQEVAALIDGYPGIQTRNLAFEIIETAALDDLEVVSAVIRQGELLGLSFALDDFGTGYSSLTYFRRLPAKVLKIDPSFVRDMLTDHEDRSIVEGIIGLARAFGRDVIAEGVESLEHGRLLLELGCDFAQGYGIAHPMEPERVPQWVFEYRQPVQWG